MTIYATETEAESDEAAYIAKIALDAAMEAVHEYHSTHGACDAPFRVSLTVDSGSEADREVSPEEYTGSAASLKESLDRSVPDDVQTHGDGWIWHEGDGRCPVHPMDMVQVWYAPSDEPIVTPAGILSWKAPKYYQRLRDEDGVPYCSAEGLEDWAEYVATDEDGGCHQYEGGIDRDKEEWLGDGHLTAPGRYINTHQHWTETLRRVWRQ